MAGRVVQGHGKRDRRGKNERIEECEGEVQKMNVIFPAVQQMAWDRESPFGIRKAVHEDFSAPFQSAEKPSEARSCPLPESETEFRANQKKN